MDRYCCKYDFSRALVHVPDAPSEIVDALWNAPDELVDSGTRLTGKQCVRTTVKLEVDAQTYVVKRHRERSIRHFAKQCFCRSRAARCWDDTWLLLESNYPTPRPVAYRENRLGPLRGNSYYVYQYIEGKTLIELAACCKNQRLLRQYVTQLAEVWRWHRSLCVILSDGHPANFVVDTAGKMWVIDLDKLQWIRNKETLDKLLQQSFLSTLRGVFGDYRIVEYGVQKLRQVLSPTGRRQQPIAA